MSDSGMPLLSGPPQPINSTHSNTNACRKCNKEFNLLFNRSKKCQHCGYSYCPTCSDYQALMPRHGTAGGVPGTATGYDAVNVCAFCIEHLQITAGGKNYLKSLPLSKLRKYANAYNIKINRAVEKDDIIEAIMSARGSNGCLSPENERFYRKYSVPDRTAGGAARPRGIFSRSGETPAANAGATSSVPPRPAQQPRPDFPRPDLEPDPPYPTPHQEHHQPPPPPLSSPGPNSPPRRPYPPPQTPPWEYRPPPPPPPPQWEFRPPPPPQQWEYQHPPLPRMEYRPPPPPQWQYRPPPPPSSPQHPGSNTWGHLPPQPDYYNYGTTPTHPYPQPSYPPPPHPPPPSTSTRPSPSHPQYHTHTQEPIPSRPASAHPPQPAPRPPSSPRRQSQSQLRPQSQPPQSQPRRPWSQSQSQPTLDDLLSMDSSDIHSLSISVLKSILFTNHVNVNATMVLEKGDLVQRVMQLVGDERRERERARRANEDEQREREAAQRAEEEQYMEMVREAERMSLAEVTGQHEHEHEHEHGEAHGEDLHRAPSEEGASSTAPPRPTSAPSSSSSTADKKPTYKDRSGLCVICQDEEANIAIVDCGHLAMCRGCSDLVMASSRECPLCRTRIVTEARLLRIFKT